MPEKVYNAVAETDEILFKDVDGQFKVLRGGSVERWEGPGAAVAAVVPGGGSGLELPAAVNNFPALVDQVVTELKLLVNAPELEPRVRQLVLSRFKDIRDAIEIREALVRPATVGGLGLPPARAEQAMGVIERHYQRWSEGGRRQHDLSGAELQANVGNMAPPVMASVPPEPAAAMPSAPLPGRPVPLRPLPPTPPPVAVPLPPLDMVSRPSPFGRHDALPTPSLPPVFAPAPHIKPSPPFAPRTVPAPIAVTSPEPPLLVPPVAPPEAVAVPEVRHRPQLVGPLEEIRQMTLVDFRRLDRDPHQATARLHEKIALLEQQSFAHKAAAIAAWRVSDVFARYTAAAATAMAGKIPITHVLPSGPTDPDTLSVAEFEAVADFNRTLRF